MKDQFGGPNWQVIKVGTKSPTSLFFYGFPYLPELGCGLAELIMFIFRKINKCNGSFGPLTSKVGIDVTIILLLKSPYSTGRCCRILGSPCVPHGR